MRMKTCPACGGKGNIVYTTGLNADHLRWQDVKECPRCDGRGKIPEDED